MQANHVSWNFVYPWLRLRVLPITRLGCYHLLPFSFCPSIACRIVRASCRIIQGRSLDSEKNTSALLTLRCGSHALERQASNEQVIVNCCRNSPDGWHEQLCLSQPRLLLPLAGAPDQHEAPKFLSVISNILNQKSSRCLLN